MKTIDEDQRYLVDNHFLIFIIWEYTIMNLRKILNMILVDNEVQSWYSCMYCLCIYHSKKYTFHKQSRKIWNKCNIQKTPPNCSWRHLDFSQIKCELCDKFKKMFDDAEKLRLNLYNSYIVHYHYVYWWFFGISVTGRKHEAQIL